MYIKLFLIILFYFIRSKYEIEVILNYFSLFIMNIKLFLIILFYYIESQCEIKVILNYFGSLIMRYKVIFNYLNSIIKY